MLAGGQNPFSQEADAAADVDQDGLITVADAQDILQFYLKNTVARSNISWDDLIEGKI